MTVREAEALRDLWADYLRRDDRPPLMPPADTKAEVQLGKLLRRDPIPVIPAAADQIWVWSDLHLSDRAVLGASRRPFWTTDEMDDQLISAWHTRVRNNDWIICLGDVAHPQALENSEMLRRLRRCPGKRLLVVGNHDLEGRDALKTAGFESQHAAALCATEPPVALSHVPLRTVPPTAINVHGHLHGNPAPTPRHVNVSVEQTDYTPVRLDQLLEPFRNQRKGFSAV